MSKEYSSLISELREKLSGCTTQHELANIKSYYLGKKGLVSNEFLTLKDALPQTRKSLGSTLNKLKDEVQEILADKASELSSSISQGNKEIDISLPGKNITIG